MDNRPPSGQRLTPLTGSPTPNGATFSPPQTTVVKHPSLSEPAVVSPTHTSSGDGPLTGRSRQASTGGVRSTSGRLSGQDEILSLTSFSHTSAPKMARGGAHIHAVDSGLTANDLRGLPDDESMSMAPDVQSAVTGTSLPSNPHSGSLAANAETSQSAMSMTTVSASGTTSDDRRSISAVSTFQSKSDTTTTQDSKSPIAIPEGLPPLPEQKSAASRSIPRPPQEESRSSNSPQPLMGFAPVDPAVASARRLSSRSQTGVPPDDASEASIHLSTPGAQEPREPPAAVSPPFTLGDAPGLLSSDYTGTSGNQGQHLGNPNLLGSLLTANQSGNIGITGRGSIRRKISHLSQTNASTGDDEFSKMEVSMYWQDSLVRYGGFDPLKAAELGEHFANHQLPIPSSDAHVYLTHDFLKEVGVNDPGTRARVILACRRMPEFSKRKVVSKVEEDLNKVLDDINNGVAPPTGGRRASGEAGKTSSPNSQLSTSGLPTSSYSIEPEKVVLEEYESAPNKYTWIDLRGNDLKDGECPEYHSALKQLLDLVDDDDDDIGFTFKMNDEPSGDGSNTDGAIVTQLPNEEDPIAHSINTERLQPGDASFSNTNNIIMDVVNTQLPLPQIHVDPFAPSKCIFVLRVCTLDGVSDEDDSVRELTNRWMVFVDSATRVVATIHRVDSHALAQMRDHWVHYQKLTFNQFVLKILERFLAEYRKALETSDDWLDRCEAEMLQATQSDTMLRSLFHLQRRCSVYDRMVALTKQLLEHEVAKQLKLVEEVRSLKPMFDELQGRCSELQSRAQNLLEIHLSLVGYHTNELMKVLTKFSMFFAPITFIAGIYGMNFETMPELRYENGYYLVLGAMALVVVLIQLGFHLKKL